MVRLAAYRVGRPNFRDYLVLGDDVVIASEEVANEYSIIIKGLGVSISLPKRVISDEKFSRCEFASRLFLNGKEYSPLPIGLVLESQFSISRLLSLWTNLYLRCRVSDRDICEGITTPDLGASVPLRGSDDLKTL